MFYNKVKIVNRLVKGGKILDIIRQDLSLKIVESHGSMNAMLPIYLQTKNDRGILTCKPKRSYLQNLVIILTIGKIIYVTWGIG